MGPAKWLKCEDPERMLRAARIKSDSRKLRLFAVACARRLWPHLIVDASRAAVEFAEGTAEVGKTHRQGWRAIRKEADAVAAHLWLEAQRMRNDASFAAHMMRFYAARAAQYTLDPIALQAAYSTSMWAAVATGWTSVTVARDGSIDGPYYPAVRPEKQQQAHLLRDVLGNPYHPVTLPAALFRSHDRTILRLAQAIYEERAFERLPILADALEEAGCEERTILKHLRGGGEHARGCWVLDLVRAVD